MSVRRVHRRKWRAAAFVFCLGGLPALGMAQDTPQELQKQQAALGKEAARADVSPRGVLQDTRPTITLETGESGGTLLTGKIGLGTNRENNNFQGQVTFQAPFDAKDPKKEVGFLNLDGLTGGTAATLNLTFERVQLVTRPGPAGLLMPRGEPLSDMCEDANDVITGEFRENHPRLDNVRACTPGEVQRAPTLFNKIAAKKEEALWEMCKEINKKRGTDLLAPPGENRDGIPGYRGACSESEVIDAREAAFRKEIQNKADLRFLSETAGRPPLSDPDKKALEDRLLLEERTKACEEFNKTRTSGERVTACSERALAEASVREVLRGKEEEARVAACQEELVVPDAELFRTGDTVSGNCLLSSLLDFAFASRQPAAWYRRILRSVPLRFWYLTLSGTRADQAFKSFNPDNGFKATTDNSDSTSVELDGSLFTRGWFFSVGAGQQRRFSAAPSQQVCFPREGQPGALNCIQGALAGPSHKDVEFLRGEIRTFLRPNVGGTLRAIFDSDASEWELHGLLHFLQNPNTRVLNGGIDLQYNTEAINKTDDNPKGDHFTVRLFVGTKFDLPFLPGNPPSRIR